MYHINLINGSSTASLHDPFDDIYRVLNPKLKLQTNCSGTFEFEIPPDHPHYGDIKVMQSEVIVIRDGIEIFRGRPIDPKTNINGITSYTCEGELGYLLDSIQRPYEYAGDVPELFAMFVERHNQIVDEKKRFAVGNVTVTDPNNYIVRKNGDLSNTLEEIQKKLVESLGGYLVIRWQDGIRYLDYLTEYPSKNTQTIAFGENLMDLSSYQEPRDIKTALIPYGAELEDGTKLTVASVNEGKDYIIDDAAVNKYGYIWETVTFEDITLPENLLNRAKRYLAELTVFPETMELAAADLSYIDIDVDRLHLGKVRIVSVPHGIDKEIMLSAMQLNLNNPAADSYTLGEVRTTLTRQEQQDTDNAVSTMREYTDFSLGGRGGYVVLDHQTEEGENRTPWRILIMDSVNKEDAVEVLQLNKNGIGFSRNGINGPYDTAWTIDGTFVADFIKAGTLQGIKAIFGGLNNQNGILEIQDKDGFVIGEWGKDGIKIYDGLIEGSDIILNYSVERGTYATLVMPANDITEPESDNLLRADRNGLKVRASSADFIMHINGDALKFCEFSDSMTVFGEIKATFEGFILKADELGTSGINDRTYWVGQSGTLRKVCSNLVIDVEYQESGGQDWVTSVEATWDETNLTFKNGLMITDIG